MKKLILSIFLLGIAQFIFSQELNKPTIRLSIYFGGGSYYVDDYQSMRLMNLLKSLEDLTLYRIYIHGHTDDIGSLEYNQRLSDLRTDEVFKKMIEFGVRKESIFQTDYGELNPMFNNEEWEGKLKNRRVDIILKKLQA